MSIYVTRRFWALTAERAFRTAAQVAAGTIGATALFQSVDWSIVGGSTALASILSVLMSIGAARVGDESPSFI